MSEFIHLLKHRTGKTDTEDRLLALHTAGLLSTEYQLFAIAALNIAVANGQVSVRDFTDDNPNYSPHPYHTVSHYLRHMAGGRHKNFPALLLPLLSRTSTNPSGKGRPINTYEATVAGQMLLENIVGRYYLRKTKGDL